MVALYESGLSIYKIGKQVDRAPGSVQQVLRRNNVEMRSKSGRPRRELNEEQKREVVERYRAGANIPAIAKVFQCGVGLISLTLAEAGVQLRKIGQQPFRPSGTQRAEIVALYQGGMGTTGIAKATGHGEPTIRRILTESGITIVKGPRTGPDSPVWKGGRVKNGDYVYVWIDANDPMVVMAPGSDEYQYVAEHRLVMARSVGRPLTSDESVHHINGDPTDNRIENLQLRHRYHGKGHAAHCLDCGSTNIAAAKLR